MGRQSERHLLGQFGFSSLFQSLPPEQAYSGHSFSKYPQGGGGKNNNNKKTNQNSQRAPAVAGSRCVEQDKQQEQVPVGLRVHGDDG